MINHGLVMAASLMDEEKDEDASTKDVLGPYGLLIGYELDGTARYRLQSENGNASLVMAASLLEEDRDAQDQDDTSREEYALQVLTEALFQTQGLDELEP